MATARKVVVRLPAKEFNLEQSQDILARALTRGGCTGCYSGIDVSFIHEVELVVNEEQ